MKAYSELSEEIIRRRKKPAITNILLTTIHTNEYIGHYEFVLFSQCTRDILFLLFSTIHYIYHPKLLSLLCKHDFLSARLCWKRMRLSTIFANLISAGTQYEAYTGHTSPSGTLPSRVHLQALWIHDQWYIMKSSLKNIWRLYTSWFDWKKHIFLKVQEQYCWEYNQD